jgi:zona occludens toxin
MITLITGTPGSGKSLYAVMELIRPACDNGRIVYSSGIPALRLPVVPLTVDQVRNWHVVQGGSIDDDQHGHLQHIAEGALIVIDEVQRVWRPAGSGAGVPPDIAALELHRHYGVDFVLICQHPSLLHRNVRALVGRHIHLRSTALGRYLHEWPEWQENPHTRTARSVAVRRRYRLRREGFGLYESASVHLKETKRVPWQLAIVLVALVLVPLLGFRLWSSLHSKGSVPTAQVVSSPVASASSKTSLPSPDDGDGHFLNISAVSDRVDWSHVAACVRSDSRCMCYGDSGERLVVPVPLCTQAVAAGWSGRFSRSDNSIMPTAQSNQLNNSNNSQNDSGINKSSPGPVSVRS